MPGSFPLLVRHGLKLACCVALIAWPAAADAHDASGWGGLFRSRDGGATWFQANQGRVVAGALAVAVDPVDTNHLLLGTDSGLLVTRNGGLDWDSVDSLSGPVFAVAIDLRGRQLIATSSGLSRSDDGLTWHPVAAPAGVTPARGLVRDGLTGRVYLLGWRGLFRSDDWGDGWTALESGLPDTSVTSLVVLPTADDALVGVVDGDVWVGHDTGRSWQRRSDGLPSGQVQTLAVDGRAPRWLAAANDRVFQSTDGGQTWQPVGQPLPERNTDIRGIAPGVDRDRLVLSTHRGLYTTVDGGATWSALSDNLPGHVEAGPLVRDAADSTVLYIGFSITPYAEQWRQVAEGRTATSLLSPVDVVGALAFLALLVLGAGVALRWLAKGSGLRAAERVA